MNNLYKIKWSADDSPNCYLELSKDCAAGQGVIYEEELKCSRKPYSLICDEMDALIDGLRPASMVLIDREPESNADIEKVVKRLVDRGVMPIFYVDDFDLDSKEVMRLIDFGVGAFYLHTENWDKNTTIKAKDILTLLRGAGKKAYGIIDCSPNLSNSGILAELQGWVAKNVDVLKYFLVHADMNNKENIKKLTDRMKRTWASLEISAVIPDNSSNLRWAHAFSLHTGKRTRFFSATVVKMLARINSATDTYRSFFARPDRIASASRLLVTVLTHTRCDHDGDFHENCPDRTIIWVKKGFRRIPVLVHSDLKKNMKRDGFRQEEEGLKRFIKERYAKADPAVRKRRGEDYFKDMSILDDWDLAMMHPRA